MSQQLKSLQARRDALFSLESQTDAERYELQVLEGRISDEREMAAAEHGGRYHMHGALEFDGHQVAFTFSVDAQSLEEGNAVVVQMLEPGWPNVTRIDGDEFTRDGQPDVQRCGAGR